MRNKSYIFLIIILFVVTVLMGINYFFRPFYKEIAEMSNDIKETVEVLSELDKKYQVLEQMSIEEKMAQLMAVPLLIDKDYQATSAASLWPSENKAGFVIIFGYNIASDSAGSVIKKATTSYPVKSFYPLILVDHEGGVVQRLNGPGFTKLPSWQQMCEKDASSSASLFKKSAEELASVGINIVLAPVVDLGSNNVLKNRVCSDKEKLDNTAKSFIINFGQYGIMSVIKHFPGLGSITKDPHFYYEEISVSAEDTNIFRQLLDVFPNLGVMSAHIGIKDRFENKPCSLSKDCLSGFSNSYPDSLIFTDALDMQSALVGGVETPRSLSDVAKQAIISGNDILVFGEAVSSLDLAEVLESLIFEYQNSEEFKNQADKSLLKIIKIKNIVN